jgi:hypothetical protein
VSTVVRITSICPFPKMLPEHALGSENKDLIIFNQNAHAWFVEDNYEATQSQAFDEFLGGL